MKSPEQFNPADPQYKKVEDLPKEEQEDFKNAKEGGFVKKEAAETFQEAEELAEIANVLKKEEGEVTAVDILHAGHIKKQEVLDRLGASREINPVVDIPETIKRLCWKQ